MADSPDGGSSKEGRILGAVKSTLAKIIKDTATPANMRHPLSEDTIQDLRLCLSLISARERELAQAAGKPMSERPRYADEQRSRDSVVRFHKKNPPEDKP